MSESTNQLHKFLTGHQGILFKQGHVFRSWKQLYFVLEKKNIKCYSDEYKSKLTGEYFLDLDTEIYDVPGESDGHKFMFYVCSKTGDKEDILFVSALSEKDKKEWIEALSDAIHDGFKMINQPELWRNAFYPATELRILYPQASVHVENGNILKPQFVEYCPKVFFTLPSSSTNKDMFSLIMIDFDAVNDKGLDESGTVNSLHLHWAKVNIQGNNMNTGDDIAPYASPAPVYNSGLHRFFFLLFRQKAYLSAAQVTDTVELFKKRENFSFSEWTSIMGFDDPVGVNGFYSGWEDYCDRLHEKAGYLPSVAYRSHKQDSAELARSEQAKIEQSKLDLYVDLTLQDIFPPQLVDIYAKSNLQSLSLNVTWHTSSGAIVARDGNIIPPSSVRSTPSIHYQPLGQQQTAGDSFDYYTLLMCDPDAPSRVSPSLREFVHWSVVNIPGCDVSKGVELVPYLGPAPPHASGLHRYVFSLYKQTGILSPTVIESSRTYFQTRSSIITHEWVRTQCRDLLVSVPVAIEAFLAEWDDSVDAMHNSIGWMPPEPYRSPLQEFVSKGGVIPVPAVVSQMVSEEDQQIQQLLRDEDAFMSSSSGLDSGESRYDESAFVEENLGVVPPVTGSPSHPVHPVSVSALVKKYSIHSIAEKVAATTADSAVSDIVSSQNSVTQQHEEQSTTASAHFDTSTSVSNVSNSSTSHHHQQQHHSSHHESTLKTKTTLEQSQTSQISVNNTATTVVNVDTHSEVNSSRSSNITSASTTAKKFIQRNASVASVNSSGIKKPSIQRSPSVVAMTPQQQGSKGSSSLSSEGTGSGSKSRTAASTSTGSNVVSKTGVKTSSINSGRMS